MQEQPPPGPDHLDEVPPPGWRGITKRQFWCWVVILPLVFLFFVSLSAPVVLRSKVSERTIAIGNAKQIGMCLIEFDMEYGSFPSDSTAAEVVKNTSSTLDFSDGSSNAIFRQLIAFGATDEAIFHGAHPEGDRRPDGRIDGRNALASGETGFSYVHGLDSTMSSNTPVLLTPMRTTSADQFWGKNDFGGKAIVVRLDNSIDAPIIRGSDGRALIGGGETVLDPSRPCFGGKKPDIRHPTFGP